MTNAESGRGDGAGNRREWVLVLLVTGVIVLLLQVPYLLGYASAGAGTVYTGLLVNVEDANYITIIQRGSEGAWTHSLRFTSEPDVPAFLYVFYLAWGHVARVFGLDATTMGHVARAGMTLVTFAVGYGFIRTFVAEQGRRWVAFLLAILGAGFDWFVFPWESVSPTSAIPVDLKMQDAHLFAAALTFPHYLASIALLMIVFWCAVRLLGGEAVTRGKFWALLVGGAVANIALAVVYPFFVILACGVVAVYLALLTVRERKLLWREIGIAAGLIIPVVPLAGYYAVTLASSELLRVWSAQSQTLSPNPLHYVLTFAPYLILAGVDLWRVRLGDAAQAKRRLLLWTWVLVVAVLVYAPIGAQRRFLQGAQVPLAILATFGWFDVVMPRVKGARWFQKLAARPNYSAEGVARLLTVLLVLVVGLSSAFQWVSAVVETTVAQPYPLFRPRGEVVAMDWLRGKAGTEDVVLSSYFSGSYLPYRSGARVYLGHFYETIYFQQKQDAVDRFFDGTMDEAAQKKFLNENGIRYLFYGEAEKELGRFEPQRAEYLKPVFENDEVVIYQVEREIVGQN